MKEIKPILLVVLASAIMIVAWPPIPTAMLLFVGLVPLFILHHQLKNKKRKHLIYWSYSYLFFFLFNLGTTWWVWNASESGAIMMLFANSLLMSIPFLLFSITNSYLPKTKHNSIIVYYLAFEYFHFNWNASWPWLTLGKGLATYPWLIQWYEFTGEMGGTFLILLFNVWLFHIYINQNKKQLAYPIITMALIIAISFSLRYFSYEEKNTAINCVVVQPNIDPYKEKFEGTPNYIYPDEQMNIALSIAKSLINPQTDLLLLPETALVGFNVETNLNSLNAIEPLRKLTDSNKLTALIGSETIKVYESKEKPTVTARLDDYSGKWWDSYNTALLIKNNRVDSIYHKSKLVPGVEKMPFSWLEKLSISLGGASGSLGVSDKPINFDINKKIKIAPLICYESVFGDYATEFVKDGANTLAVITNDAWWGNTPGHKQHLLFGAIRCIETRREMVRSANTGISAKINRYGEITHKTKFNEKIAFKCSLIPNNKLTFYVKYGNLIGKFSSYSAVFLITAMIALFVKKKFN